MKLQIIDYGSFRNIVAKDPRWHLVREQGYRLDNPEFDYKELIDLSLRFANGGIAETPYWRIQRIRRALEELPHVEEFFAHPQFWPKLAKALKDPGVNRMFQEEVTDGLHSEFLAPSYALMPSAITLMMPFQKCINLRLEMADVTPADPYHRISLVEQGYQYTRVRTSTTAEVLVKMLISGTLRKALVLNCGCLLEFLFFPELRKAIMDSNATFYVNDTDPKLKLEELIPEEDNRKHFQFYHQGQKKHRNSKY